MPFTDQEIEEFKSESRDLLDTGETNLLSLDDTGQNFKVAFDAVFRSFHNLKGAAGMMELVDLQAHTHELESILMQFKDKGSIPKEYISFFLRGIDGARTLLDGGSIQFDYSIEKPVQTPVEEPNPEMGNSIMKTALQEFLAEGDEIVQRVAHHLRLMEAQAHTRDIVDETYRDIHSLKGAAYLFGFQAMGDIAHAMESVLDSIRSGTHVADKALIDILYKAVDAIEREVECARAGTPNPEGSVVAAQIQKALSAAGANLVSVPAAAATAVQAAPTPAPILTPQAAAPTPAAPANPAPKVGAETEAEGAGTIRVSVSLLDNLMTLMGEMVLVRNQVLQFSNNSEDMEFVNLSKRLSVVTSEIQGEMMKTRMQPIGNILSKFHRVVRDLSQELGKSINLQLSGAETELDKSLLEAIKDPLTHIVRNSCDHGIETKEARRQGGKSETGTILIKSYHEGGQVVIEVSDDGKGLSREHLIRKAVEKGLITEAQGAQMVEKEVFNLIFLPGFSTAQKITNVSGRGVGMDVVRTNIEKIGGTVDLSSRTGHGTVLRLKIPLTLAIVPALIVHSGGSTFAIPQVKLVELVRVDQSSEHQIEYLQGTPVYRLRGDILPLIDLNQVLRHDQKRADQGVINIAVLNAEDSCFGLIIDEVEDTADIVVKPLNRLLKSLQVYSGATVLGDGSVALILDVIGISKVAKLNSEAAKSEERAALHAKDAERRASHSEIQDFLLVRVNSPTKHAIVLNYVNRLEEFRAKDLEISGTSRVVRYRGNVLPIISANQHLGYAVNETKSEIISVVVVERGGQLFGVQVDDILDTLSTDRSVDTSLSTRAGFIGNISTEQELIVVIDPFELIGLEFPKFNAAPQQQIVAAAKGKETGVSVAIASDRAIRILLAEDTAFFRNLVRGHLEKAGHTVVVVNDGVEALQALEKESGQFDLIISDIEMPRMNGFKLAESVRAHKQFCGIPLLALSSRFDQLYVQQGTEAGFNVYLEKMKPETLLTVVNQLAAYRKESA